MDCATLYKKKTLKFTNSHVSRNSRQLELSKARETSRFKRNSMLRNCFEEKENVSSTEIVTDKVMEKCEQKKPQSRLEMLFKWKEEKKIKKELENKKKPFYVGGHVQRYNPSMGLPPPTLSNSSCNSSKLVKSKLVPPASLPQPAKTTNISKQITPSVSKIALSSKIPNKFGLNKVKTTNEIKTTNTVKNPKTFGNSAIPPSSRQGTLPRTAKSNNEVKTGIKSGMNEKSVKVKTQTGIPTIPSSVPKGIFVQKPKNQVNSNLSENVTIRRQGFGFKPTFNKQTGGIKASNSNLIKKLEGKNNSVKSQKEETPLKESLDEKIPAEIFNCDISIIKNPPSFAPANFSFIPPAGLLDFSLNTEVKETIISRTSTPSKPSKESSVPKNSGEKVFEDSMLEDSFHVPLEADAEKMKEIFLKFKKILKGDKELKTGQEHFPIEGEIKEATKLLEDSCADSLVDVDSKKTEEKSSKDINIVKLQNEELNNSKEHFPVEEKIKECTKLLVEEEEDLHTDYLVDVGLKNTEELLSKDINLVELQNEELSKEHFPVEAMIKECTSTNLLEEDLHTDSLIDVGLKNTGEKLSKDINLVELQDEELTREHFPVDGEIKESTKLLEDLCADSLVDVVGFNETEGKSSKDINLVKLQNEELNNSIDQLPSENQKIARELEITNIDSPLDILDLDKSIDLCPMETHLIKSDDNGKEHVPSEMENKKCTKVLEDLCIDSPFDIVGLKKTEGIATKNIGELNKLPQDEFTDDDVFTQQDFEKCIKKKSLSITGKRRSTLRRISVLNSIAEIAETNETPSKCQTDSHTSVKPTCSRRLSKLADVNEYSPDTPRRSSRIKNIAAQKSQLEDLEIPSPTLRNTPRRSMRLIDLNTPEKDKINSSTNVTKTNLTLDFERLTLMESENMNPHACLNFFECSPITRAKSKKISLLYSPEKVSAIRKSIRGDLMSFSPSD